jgi:phosphatidylglycerophosphate synthase
MQSPVVDPRPAAVPPGDGPGAFWQDLRSLPNALSLYRIVGIVATCGLFATGHPRTALGIGVSAGLSDYLDGYVARRTGRVTDLGALLDAGADACFSLVCFVIAVHRRVWPAYLLLVWGIRDIGVLLLRGSAAQQGFVIRTRLPGKVGTNVCCYSFVLMAIEAVPLVAARGAVATGIHWTGLLAVHVGLALLWLSALLYLRSYVRSYRREAPALRSV